MSSILKALQKLEKETALSGNESPVTSENRSSGPVVSLSLLPFLNNFGKIAALLVSVVFVFWLVVHFNSDEGEEISLTNIPPSPNTQVPETHEIIKPAEKTTPTPPLAQATIPPIEDDPKKAAPPEPSRLVQEKSDPPESVEKTENSALSGNPSFDPPESGFKETEKMMGASWLTLQAISWSEEPKKRIAVINNAIVKQGWSVERGTVTLIEKDYVVVKSDNKEWTLSFGRP